MKTIIALAFAISINATVQAQSQDPAWIDDLRLQLLINIQCHAEYLLNIREYEGSTGRTQSARVQCSDGRMFDAKRAEPDADFKVEACGQQVCDAGKVEKTLYVIPASMVRQAILA